LNLGWAFHRKSDFPESGHFTAVTLELHGGRLQSMIHMDSH
jgi:hypothetical protein